MHGILRAGVLCICVVASCLAQRPQAATAQSRPSVPLAGAVRDTASGLPVAGATLEVVEVAGSQVRTDARGEFSFALPAGRYHVRISAPGYAPSLSDTIDTTAGTAVSLTLGVAREQSAGSAARVIGSTSVRASESLQRASTIYRTLSPDALAQSGTFRAADALRLLPGVNNGITGDTAALGDDVNISLRGIGVLETTTTLDGHPIAQGIDGGYNFELSPIFNLRNITVTYGSGGSDLLGVNAIGGVIDMQTLEPTRERHTAFMQGYGTFSKFATSLATTGTSGKLGYAFGYGVASTNGPVNNAFGVQPGAAFDQSATAPAVVGLGAYKADSLAVARSGLFKLRYALGDNTRVTFAALADSYWDDKTGNGDEDYLPYDTALATGRNLLAGKGQSDQCPAGTFAATNANGAPNGAGPDGKPDGGMPCQTPGQYANFNTGYQGAGPAWQSFGLNDYQMRFETVAGAHTIRLDGFTDTYSNTFDRTFQLPFAAVPGDSGVWRNQRVTGTGVTVSDNIAGRNNDFGFGYSYVNSAYFFRANGVVNAAPITNDTAFFLRNVYHPVRGKVTTYANAWFKHSTVTNSSYVDPRLSVVYLPDANDVVRVAAGATSAQPYASYLNAPYSPSAPGGAGGGGNISCTALNSVGNAPSSLLKPERAVDTEIAYGHRFGGDSQVQATFYNANVYQKLYSSIVPLALTGTSFIDPAQLATFIGRINSRCGAVGDPLALLGVTGNVNLGTVRASGLDITGRIRATRGLYVDYDWALTSAVLTSAPPALLQRQLSLIPGAQLPRVPLHTASVALDGMLGRLEARFTTYVVSGNNTKALPPYNFSEFQAGIPLGRGSVTVALSNVFNQWSQVPSFLGLGVPLALNQYATAADYAPLIGTAATERFGLPPRRLYAGYTVRL